MTDFEKKVLDISKERLLKPEEQFEIEGGVEDPIDRAALMAVLSLRANLQNQSKEPQALWRFIRYLTEIEMPLKFIDFTYMLFPGNEKYYANILTPTAFNMIQKQAAAMLENEQYENEEHKLHLEKVATGQMPYGYSIEMPKKED